MATECGAGIGDDQKNSPVASFLPSSMDDDNSFLVDELMDFSSDGCSHWRSVSDSLAMIEAELNEDDLQLTSIFSDEFLSPPTPSPDSYHRKNGNGNENQNTFHVGRSASNEGPAFDKTADLKRIKRIIANRQSAKRSRLRKLHYISELEQTVTKLQMEVSTLSTRVAFFDRQRSILAHGNNDLHQRIDAVVQDNISKDAHKMALSKERERLKQVCHRQGIGTMEASAPPSATGTATNAMGTFTCIEEGDSHQFFSMKF